MQPLANLQIRQLKAKAQLLEPTFKVGKAGLSEIFIQTVNDGLDRKELVKIQFVSFKAEKKELGPKLAEATSSHLVMQVGNVIVLYRPAKPSVTETSVAK